MTNTPSISENLRRATGLLQGCSDSPRLDAEVLLAKVLKKPRSALVTSGDMVLADPTRIEYERLVGERRRGVPVAYLTGTREFWSLPLTVTPDVLVPRPETEDLVELVLARLPPDRAVSVVDLGTGSGAIALAIASERPLARITATDLSSAALAVAAANAKALHIGNIEWRQGSWFEALAHGCYDAVVSNPPYVAAGDPALEALCCEPALALSPGADGMEAFAAIAAGAPAFLRPGGFVALEHGRGQAPALAALLRRHSFTDISSHNDRAAIARAMLATFHPSN